MDATLTTVQIAEAEQVYSQITAAERKLVTIEDFLVNQFDLDEDQYTKHELYEMLDHVTRLLDTEDGTLRPEQQLEANHGI
jgi:hypothetical protein